MRRKFKGIYLITIETPEVVYRYVGQSIDVISRKGQHISDFRKNKHRNGLLQNVFNKYGESTYKFQALEELPNTVTAEELTEKEEYYCQLFQTYTWDSRSGCNLREAESTGKFSPETKRNMSIAQKKLWSDKSLLEERTARLKESLAEKLKDPEYREKRAEDHRQRWEDPEFREKVTAAMNTKENREKQSQALKEKWQDPEFRERVTKAIVEGLNTVEYKEKASQAHIERWKDPEFREKVVSSMNSKEAKEKKCQAAKARCQNPEAKQRLSKAGKKAWEDPEFKKKMTLATSKPVRVQDPEGNIREYLSIGDFMKDIGCSRETVSRFLKGKVKESRLLNGWRVL